MPMPWSYAIRRLCFLGNGFGGIWRWAMGVIVLVGTLSGPVGGMEQGTKRFVRTLDVSGLAHSGNIARVRKWE